MIERKVLREATISERVLLDKIRKSTNNRKLHKDDYISSQEGFIKLLTDYSDMFTSVLDIGSGRGTHASILSEYNKQVHTVDYGTSEYAKQSKTTKGVLKEYIGDYMEIKFDTKYDCVMANHILEHQLNPNLFLKKVFNDLKDGGVLLITVPPMKNEIVGGHVTLWNTGLLLYNLILAGFDCSDAIAKTYGYNITVIVKKRYARIDDLQLCYDKGDIEKLSKYFPKSVCAKQNFNGDIKSIGW